MDNKQNMQSIKAMSYKTFSLIIVISFFIMYLVMFLNMDMLDYYHTSATRIYMALLMVLPMAVVMMLLMGKMYPHKKNIYINHHR